MKTAGVAQHLLKALLMLHTPEKLMQIEDITTLLTAILAYSERQYGRTVDMLEESYLLDFSLAGMNPVIQ